MRGGGASSATLTGLASQVVRLGYYMGYAPPGTSPLALIALAQEAERLGYDSAWAAEAWGTDAVSVLSWRAALRRETVEHHGSEYEIPFRGDGATGLGKPLKLMLRPLRADIPIYLAAISPKAVELAFEIADGWIPIFFSPDRAREVFGLDGRVREGFDVAATSPAIATDDLQAARDQLKSYY